MHKPLIWYSVALSGLVIVSLLIARAGELQFPAVVAPAEKIGKPKASPEPSRKLPKSPIELFSEVTSDDAQTRERGMKDLVDGELEMGDNDRPPQARIEAVQLDDDPELQYVLVVHNIFPSTSYVIIADKTSDGWHAVGTFEYSYMWDELIASNVVQIQPPFVLVKESTGGSGFFTLTASIYRLWEGRLYKTLELGEHAEDGGHFFHSDAKIEFRWAGFLPWSEPWIALEVRTDETEIPEDRPNDQPRSTHSCDGYEWVPATFSFVRTARATQALCK